MKHCLCVIRPKLPHLRNSRIQTQRGDAQLIQRAILHAEMHRHRRPRQVPREVLRPVPPPLGVLGRQLPASSGRGAALAHDQQPRQLHERVHGPRPHAQPAQPALRGRRHAQDLLGREVDDVLVELEGHEGEDLRGGPESVEAGLRPGAAVPICLALLFGRRQGGLDEVLAGKVEPQEAPEAAERADLAQGGGEGLEAGGELEGDGGGRGDEGRRVEGDGGGGGSLTASAMRFWAAWRRAERLISSRAAPAKREA
uniref:Uncharacterized protein n=1 Tax=Bionectria ochroleuca TaxID=29856 RepID=A0A8H7KFZ6_BIOOC